MFYWVVGPGYYQSTVKTQISGHNVSEQRSYFGAQAALGVNIPVFRWEGFLEVSAAKLFSPGPDHHVRAASLRHEALIRGGAGGTPVSTAAAWSRAG